MSTDLIAELRAALDAEEATAKAAKRSSDGTWLPDDLFYPGSGRIVDSAGDVVVYDEGAPSEKQADHIARHDPAFVLADIAAKRKLIDLHAKSHPCPAFDQYPGGQRFVDPSPQWRTEPCATLRLLAEAYGIRA